MTEAPSYLGRGLAVAHGVRIRKIRRFPLTGEIRVREGESVQWNTLLGYESAEEKLHVVKVETYDEKVIGAIVRQVGDSVKRGEAVALSTFALGLGLTEYCSPVDGIVTSIDSITGTIVIREYPEPLRALIPGIVREVKGNEGVVIETVGTYVEGMFGAGRPNGGQLLVLTGAAGEVVPPQEITLEHAGKALVIGAECRHEHLMAALKCRVACVISGGGDLEAILAFQQFVSSLSKEEYEARFGGSRDPNVIWREDDYVPGVTVVITEGFGKVPIRADVFEALKKREGEYAFIDVPGPYSLFQEPPGIIIPEGDAEEKAPWLERNIRKELRPGSRVRLIGFRCYGQTGVVEDLSPVLPEITGVGNLRACKVRLDSGKSVTVPRQNVEALDID